MPVNSDDIQNVVIVGGGSAGWLSAARIAARNGRTSGGGVSITLIESANVPAIGVGEGTWPTMRNTLARIGLSETDFIRSCDATFKQGARFVGWTDGTPGDAYYHPLNPPAGAIDLNLAPHWASLEETRGRRSFADSVDVQEALCRAGLAPKAITSPEYGGAANYAYHLDAGAFATLLRDHAVGTLGVRHVVADVTRVRQHLDGDIAGLDLSSGEAIDGELFVDCTGFAAILIGGVYGVPFTPCGGVLFPDRAVAMQVPYAEAGAPIACHTISTAQAAGWIWDIGLQARRGTGYVYSSAHVGDDEAEAALRRYIGPQAEALSSRRIAIRSGHRAWFWQNNCVAVGLSAGFLEPLEASALMLIETSMDFIADRLPRTRDAMAVIAGQFNGTFQHHWRRIVEFLKLHYVLTRRGEAFWQDNRLPESIPGSLRERLELWRVHPPGPQDFSHSREVFSWPSYQYVLHGMGFETRYSAPASDTAKAQRLMARVDQLRDQVLRQMPKHRDLIDKIRTYGLQTV